MDEFEKRKQISEAWDELEHIWESEFEAKTCQENVEDFNEVYNYDDEEDLVWNKDLYTFESVKEKQVQEDSYVNYYEIWEEEKREEFEKNARIEAKREAKGKWRVIECRYHVYVDLSGDDLSLDPSMW